MSHQPPGPNIERLVEIAHAYADVLGVERASEIDVREKLDEILFRRDAFEHALSGLITDEELVNLILAHVHTLLSRDVSPYPGCVEDAMLHASVHAALFGHRGAEP